MILGLVFSCAKPGSPTGGPKDTRQPVVEETKPSAGATNVMPERIDITFNEYVQLNNIQQNLIVSPPFSEKPEVRIRGKGIRIILPEEPAENTTYSFTFLDAISDITERNKVTSLVYAFSTGDIIDSLRMGGSVIDAWTEDKMQDVLVMLYKNPADSAFKTSEPDYLTKTNKDGDFRFFYLAPGKYRLYALEDANNSFTFDQPNEKIAFLDSLIVPRVTVERDSTDTIVHYKPHNITLRLFEPEQYQQFIETSSRPRPDKLEVYFKREHDSVVNWYSPDFSEENVYTEFSDKADSLQFWLRDSSITQQDSLRMILSYYSGIDSIGQQTDTLVFSPKKEADNILKIKSNASGGTLNYWDSLRIEIPSVLSAIDTAKMQLFRIINDSTEKALPVDGSITNPLHISIEAKLMPGKSYRLIVDTAAITDVFERRNDSTGIEFSVNEENDFAALKLRVPETGKGWFCDLMQSDKLIRRKAGNAEGLFEFSRLDEGTYDIRLVHDKNQNQQWDTGDFDQTRQPEQVYYKSESIELRAGWTQETEWLLFNSKDEEK
jgi:uncharacterized protein (DUF2141 family)